MATYGIDLGTTYSCIAYVDKTGRPVVLKNADGEETTPSVVFFESPEHVVVGTQAKASAVLSPDLVAELIKRKIGQDVHYNFHGQDHTPESISALILRELARSAGEKTGEEVHDVVITVPAYFGLLEREATRKAGQIAGLNVLDVLAEPVAAALDYQLLGDDADGVRHIFVYDLGGGTFDTTVIRVSGNEIQVICTDGDHQLGGADWDNAIIDFLLRSFTDQYPQLDPSGDEQFMQELSISVEQLKKSLSASMARKQVLRFDGSAMQVELTRDQLEELTSELVERTMEITSRTIDTARQKGVEKFDDVLLVGGMTITPVIKESLKERFAMEARQREPHVAVARGAALFALMQQLKVLDEDTAPGSGKDKAEELAGRLDVPVEQVQSMAAMRVATVVPRAFGLNVVDAKDPLSRIDPSRARHYIEHLLTANTPLPADTGPQQFATVSRNQRQVRLEVWEQAGSTASRELAHNNHIGEGVLQGLPDGPAGTPFDVEFHMTEMGLLKVHAFEPVSRQEVDFEIQIGHLDAAEVQEATDAVARYEVSG
jgi:molecular chaperone DnaK